MSLSVIANFSHVDTKLSQKFLTKFDAKLCTKIDTKLLIKLSQNFEPKFDTKLLIKLSQNFEPKFDTRLVTNFRTKLNKTPHKLCTKTGHKTSHIDSHITKPRLCTWLSMWWVGFWQEEMKLIAVSPTSNSKETKTCRHSEDYSQEPACETLKWACEDWWNQFMRIGGISSIVKMGIILWRSECVVCEDWKKWTGEVCIELVKIGISLWGF
jgi:hypothetical protein